jgi:hypothetical protein
MYCPAVVGYCNPSLACYGMKHKCLLVYYGSKKICRRQGKEQSRVKQIINTLIIMISKDIYRIFMLLTICIAVIAALQLSRELMFFSSAF